MNLKYHEILLWHFIYMHSDINAVKDYSNGYYDISW